MKKNQAVPFLSWKNCVRGVIAGAAGLVALSCSSGDLAPRSSGETTGQVTQAVNPSTISSTCACVGTDPTCSCVDTTNSGYAFIPNPQPDQKSALGALQDATNAVTGIVGTVTGVISAVQELFHAFGFMVPPDEAKQLYTQLGAQIDAVAGAINYNGEAVNRDARFNDLRDSLAQIQDDATANGNVVSESQTFWDTSQRPWNDDVSNGGAMSAFQRVYVESQTDGKWVNFPEDTFQINRFMWKGILSGYRNPQSLLSAPLDMGAQSNNLVYDWRYALPALLQLDAMRLLLFIAEDINNGLDFKRAARHTDVLKLFRADLQKHLAILTNGLQCTTVPGCYGVTESNGFVEPPPSPPDFCTSGEWVYEISCADIYSGLNETVALECGDVNPCPDAANAAMRKAYNDVRQLTPWFATQSMIDALYLYENGIADLTTDDPAIHTKLSSTLCLDVGPQLQAQLSLCTKSMPWTYTRETGLLNPNHSEACLDAVDPTLGTPAMVLPCSGGGPSQHWTYDAEQHLLHNALGNALDVPVSNPQAGQQLNTYIASDLSGLAQDFNVYDPTPNYQPEQWTQQPQYAVATVGHLSTIVPQCTNCGPTEIVLGMGLNGGLYARTSQNGAESGPVEVTAANFAPTNAAIAAGAQSTSQTDGFVVGNDGKVYVTSSTNAGTWQPPTALTVASFAPPGAGLATANQGGQLWVAVVDKSGKLEIVAWNSTWRAPVAVTAANYAPPGASVAFGRRSSGELDVFSIGTDGAIKYMSYNLGIWSGPYPLSLGNFAPPGAPVATGVDVHGFLNVFTVGNDGALYTKWDCTPLWCGATALTPKGFTASGSMVSALKFNTASLDVAVVDNTGAIDVLSNAGTSWQGPTAISAASVAPPGAATSLLAETASQLDVFAVSNDGQLLESVNTGSGWSAPRPIE
jgi:hypothetical protein